MARRGGEGGTGSADGRTPTQVPTPFDAFSRPNETQSPSAELEAYLDLWDIAEGVSLDDPAEVARSAHFRQLFWDDVACGGRVRQLAIRDLRQGLLDWLEEPPRRSLEELMAIERENPLLDVSEALAQVLDRERLRLTWAPRIRAELAADLLAGQRRRRA